MNRNQAKQLLPIIQAFSEGKEIEGIYKGIKSPWFKVEDMVFDGGTIFRVKPKYRPFANAEECWNEMKKHQPFGWLKEEGKDNYRLVGTINNEGLLFVNHANNCKELSSLGANKWLTFADGVPFGVKNEED